MSAPDTLPHDLKPVPTPTPSRSLVGPALLMLVGLLLLLGNLGVLGLPAWDALWRLWPFALIGLGVDILTRTSRWRLPALLGVLAAALLSGLWWAGGLGMLGRPTLLDQAVQLTAPQGTRDADLTLRVGVARLAVTAGTPARLVQGQVQVPPGQTFRQDVSRRGSTAVVDVGVRGTVSGSYAAANTPRWNLGLSPQRPWVIRVQGGVGPSNLDLRGLQVTTLSVQGGVGDTTVTLPERGFTQATLQVGVGAMTVRLPAGVAARITTQGGLGAVRMTLPARQDGSTYIVGDPDSAPNHATVKVQGGVGRISFEEAR